MVKTLTQQNLGSPMTLPSVFCSAQRKAHDVRKCPPKSL